MKRNLTLLDEVRRNMTMLGRIRKDDKELQYIAPTEAVPCIWQDMQQLWQDQPLQGSLQDDAETVTRPELIEEWQFNTKSPAG